MTLTMLSLCLFACQAEQKPAEKGTVAGEILPGSVSDAMLPYDTVRSQPPLAPQTEAAGWAGDARTPRPERSGAAAEASEEPAADSTPAAPAPTVTAEPVE
jgi:hypothetical protein